jgi:hypothetical protein
VKKEFLKVIYQLEVDENANKKVNDAFDWLFSKVKDQMFVTVSGVNSF